MSGQQDKEYHCVRCTDKFRENRGNFSPDCRRYCVRRAMHHFLVDAKMSGTAGLAYDGIRAVLVETHVAHALVRTICPLSCSRRLGRAGFALSVSHRVLVFAGRTRFATRALSILAGCLAPAALAFRFIRGPPLRKHGMQRARALVPAAAAGAEVPRGTRQTDSKPWKFPVSRLAHALVPR